MPTPLALYLLNEAPSGTGPTALLDTAPGSSPSVPMTITYGASGQYTSNAAGRGLSLVGAVNNGGLSATLAGTKIATALAASKTVTFIVNFDTTSAPNSFQDIALLVASGGQVILEISHRTTSDFEINLQDGAFIGRVNYTPGLHTIAVSVDTSQATAADRVKTYLDGSLATYSNSPTFPTLNSAIDSAATNWANNVIRVGSFYFNLQALTGVVYTTALYTAALNATDISNISTVLASNNDVDPGEPTITVQPVGAIVYQGRTASFSVTATAVSGSLSYQWKKNGSTISGATSSSYTTPALWPADDGSFWTCDVTDSIGTNVSLAAYVVVNRYTPSYSRGWATVPMGV